MQTRSVHLRNLMCTVIVFLMLQSGTPEVTGRRRRVRHQRSTNHFPDVQLQLEFEANNHLVNSIEWKCDVPRQRLVYLNEAISSVPQIPPDSIWLVDTTVLHRCESVFGCCSHPKTCQPVNLAPVNVTFGVMNMSTRTRSYHRILFANHTQCGCSQ